MKLKSLGLCEVCRESVSQIGSYVKLSATRWAHGQCFGDERYKAGVADGREQVVREIENARRVKEESDQRAEVERRARESAMAERRLEVQERERVNKVEAQRAMPLPPKFSPPPKEPEAPAKSRFELLDLDEEK